MKLRFAISMLFLCSVVVCVSFGQIPRTLSYQGLLTDTLGNPRPDGSYSMTFRLYDVASGGSALWIEQKTLEVQRGLFSTTLGDQVVIGGALKFEKPYWLSVQIASEPELTPRVPLTAVGYSLNSLKADSAKYAPIADSVITGNKIHNGQVVRSLNTLHDAVTLRGGTNVTITPTGDTLTISSTAGGPIGAGAAGQVAFWTGASTLSSDTNLVWNSASKRLGVGTSSPGYPITATLSSQNNFDRTISTTIDGNAQQLWGLYAETKNTSTLNPGAAILAYASSLTGSSYGIWGQANGPGGVGVYGVSTSGSGQNTGVFGYSYHGNGVYGGTNTTSDSLAGVNGRNSGSGAGGYFSSAAGPALVARGNAVVRDTLKTSAISYTTPRTNYYSVSSEAFFPTSNVAYANGGGQGGAWLATAGTGVLAATVNLPHGAVVTNFKVFFYDNSAGDMIIDLEYQSLLGGLYATLAELTTSGASTSYQSLNTSSINHPVIDNTDRGYLVWVYSTGWDGTFNMRVKGALITYTTTQP